MAWLDEDVEVAANDPADPSSGVASGDDDGEPGFPPVVEASAVRAEADRVVDGLAVRERDFADVAEAISDDGHVAVDRSWMAAGRVAVGGVR